MLVELRNSQVTFMAIGKPVFHYCIQLHIILSQLRLIDNGIKKYMTEYYDEDEQASIIEMIFNQISIVKFDTEYGNQVSFVGDNIFQNQLFNSSDLMSCILQYLEHEMNTNCDLYHYKLVNSK